MKRFFHWLMEQLAWIASANVLDAINSGATYEEVCNIVKEEAEK